MAAVLDATPGGASANSLTSLAAANAYWETQPYPEAWDAATDDLKTRALITATQLLTEQPDWIGYPTSQTQALPFPRSGLLTRSGAVIPLTVIPVDIERGTAELAGQLIAAGQMPDTPLDSAGISKLKAGPVEITFDGSAAGGTVAWLPDRVWSLIGFLVGSRAGATSVPLARG